MSKKLLLVGGGLLLVFGAFWWGAAHVAAPAPLPTSHVLFGFVRGVDYEKKTIHFDQAQWLIGKEAEDAAIAEGHCTEATRQDCIENDYYILNPATTTIELSFSSNPLVAMMTLHAQEKGIQEEHISLEEFAKLLNSKDTMWSSIPYQLLIENNLITIVEEVYVP